MKRYIYDQILSDLQKKMVFITGPRQVGKTYLAKSLEKEFLKSIYLNSDSPVDNQVINTHAWPLDTKLIILDEIHKIKGWKNYLKGTYDTKVEGQTFLVTGSARLDTFRQAGESLAGRYFSYRLNPLSVKELAGTVTPYEAVATLNRLGGFPEPFLSGSEESAQRWRRQYYTDIVREDILDFSRIHEIRAIKLMLELLRSRVGTPVSFTALSEDLQIAPNTVKKYIDILESLHIIFLVRPHHRNIVRSILKEPKVYFYDSGYVNGDEGLRLENTVAVCLLKHTHYVQDTRGADVGLRYVRTKNGREVDFALTANDDLTHLIEVKLSDVAVSSHLRYFKESRSNATAVQLVHNARHDRVVDGVNIVRAGEWLSSLEA